MKITRDIYQKQHKEFEQDRFVWMDMSFTLWNNNIAQYHLNELYSRDVLHLIHCDNDDPEINGPFYCV